MLLVRGCATHVLFKAAFRDTRIANALTIVTARPFVAAAIARVWLRQRAFAATMIGGGIMLVAVFWRLLREPDPDPEIPRSAD